MSMERRTLPERVADACAALTAAALVGARLGGVAKHGAVHAIVVGHARTEAVFAI